MFVQSKLNMYVIYLILGIIMLCILILHWYQTRSHTAKLINAFPGPWMPPIFGHSILFSIKPDVLFPQLRRVTGAFNETFRAWALHYPSVHIVSADDAEIILASAKHVHKGKVYDLFKDWLKEGLLLSTGAKWQHRRKLLTPTFHFNILRRFVDVFGEHCDKLVLKLQEESMNAKINIVPLMNHLTLSNICETAMGTKLNPGDDTQKNYLDALYKIGGGIIRRAFQPWLYNDVIYNLSPYGWENTRYVNILHKFTSSVIQAREKNFKDEDVKDLDNTDDVYKSKKRLAMLDLLISAKKNRNEIDDEGIREEVDTFMFEGHDTTSVAICNTLMTLANHADVQNKIITELDLIFGTSKRQATHGDLQMMKYTEQCIKECLRLYPSVPFITRCMKEDIRLTRHTIPAGTEVFVHIYNIHRDPKYYPNPEKFDPDRFLPENCTGRHPYTYIPFSAGPRNCIGQKFAMLELKIIIAAVLRNFRMKPIDTEADLTWVTDLVLRTSGPIHIKFIPRNINI